MINENYKLSYNQSTKTYEGSFAAQYTKLYGKLWSGSFGAQYSKLYLGNYTKTYSGAFLGTVGTYTGVASSVYTKAYVGQLGFNTVYSKVATAALATTTKAGELSDSAITRIKSAGAWKQAKEVFVKSENAWVEARSIFVKSNGAWKLEHIGWERTDITISTNTANFNLRDKLVSLSKSVSSRPQLVNIYLSGCDVYSATAGTPAMDLATGLGAINLGGQTIQHLVRVMVHPNARIIGAAGHPGSQTASTRTGGNGSNGGDAIQTGQAVELYIENYGTIAAGGGGGGSGGFPVHGSSLSIVGGEGGYGAGYATISGTLTNILENNAHINGHDSAHEMGIHGGSGGLLGQRAAAAGGFDNPNTGLAVAADGALKTLYDLSGNGGIPGAAIDNYNATRVTFINTGNIWGDSLYKYRV